MGFETEKTELAANVPSIDMNLVRTICYAPNNGFLAPQLLNRGVSQLVIVLSLESQEPTWQKRELRIKPAQV